MPKMSEPTLRALLSAQHQDAMAASNASKLSGDRSDAMAYYNGDMSKDMPAVAGRSVAVSMDVADTIEGILPQLMEVFCGSDEVVKLEPVGPEDVEAAEQETDYINHVFMNRNPGFLVLYSFIKDALLSKVGVVKVWWEKQERTERETYYDKTDIEYAMIVGNPDVEVVEHSERPAPPPEMTDPANLGQHTNATSMPPAGAAMMNGKGADHTNGLSAPPQMVHDVTVEVKKTKACARVMGVPPEEFGIERGARTVQDCNYCFHKIVDRTESDLIEQGYDEKQVKRLPSYRASSNTEEITRDTVDEDSSSGSDEINTAARQVEVTEHYIRMDYEGNNKAQLYRVTTGGDQGEILKLDGKPDIEPFDHIPFAAMTPIIVTHRFYGKSLADLVMDIQRIKTALLRALLDNAYLANNPRVEVAEQFASENTLDDLLVSRPGGIVRTKAPGGLNWQVTPTIGNHIYPLLEYEDATREWRTGVTKQGQGIDANALQNQSATAVNQAFTASQARVRLIARIFAETGVRDMMWLLHSTIKKYGQQAAVTRLRNKWVNVDPRNWKTREDLTVHVGLGSGGRAQRVAELTMLGNFQKELLLGGKTNLVTDDNLYSTSKELTKALALPNPEAFFTDPKTQPPLQPKPDPKIIELQMKSQLDERADQRKAQLDGQALQAKSQIETVQAQADIATQQQKSQAEMAIAERKAQLEERLMLLDHELKREAQAAELQMKREMHEQSLAQGQLGMAANAQAHDAKMEQMKSKPQPGAS